MNHPCQTFWVVGYPSQTRPLADLGQLEVKELKQFQNVLHNTWYYESTLPDILSSGVPPPNPLPDHAH